MTTDAVINRATLAAYGVCCLAFLATIPYSPYPGSLLTKALPVLILLGLALVALRGRVRVLLALALLLSACGDVLLELRFFTPGLAAFLIAQLCYAWYFFSQRDTANLPVARLLIVLALMCTASVPIISNAGDLLIPVAVYMMAIGLMGISAALYRKPSTVLFVGALLFVASDSMIGFNRFVSPLPAAHYAIMMTYYGAQLLILWGVLATEKHPRQA